MNQARSFTIGNQRVTIHHAGSVANRNVITQCFVDQQYEILETGVNYRLVVRSYYGRIVAQGGTPLITDAGADIGAAALWFRATYPKTMIVAVEPAADNFKRLRVNCTGPGFDTKEAAFGPLDGQTIMTDPGASADFYWTGVEGSLGYTVPVISVATILRQYPGVVPFILKIDIEGGEKRLLDGDTTALAEFPLVAVEPHDWMLPGQGTALGCFKFHTEAKRDFCYHRENVFSLDYVKLVEVVPVYRTGC